MHRGSAHSDRRKKPVAFLAIIVYNIYIFNPLVFHFFEAYALVKSPPCGADLLKGRN